MRRSIKGCLRLFSPFLSDNLGLYTASDISSDEAVQDVPPDKDEIEPVVFNQIQR